MGDTFDSLQRQMDHRSAEVATTAVSIRFFAPGVLEV